MKIRDNTNYESDKYLCANLLQMFGSQYSREKVIENGMRDALDDEEKHR